MNGKKITACMTVLLFPVLLPAEEHAAAGKDKLPAEPTISISGKASAIGLAGKPVAGPVLAQVKSPPAANMKQAPRAKATSKQNQRPMPPRNPRIVAIKY